MIRRRSARDQSGVVAVVVAASALVLFGAAALAVDLGNAQSRKRDAQSQADLAALAAGGALPVAAATNCPATHPARNDLAVTLAMDYFNENQPLDDKGASTVTSRQLANCNFNDGEVVYVSKTRIRVDTPSVQVDFGMANVLGTSDTSIVAEAEVEYVPPPMTGAVLPLWISGTCSYGPQGGDPAGATQGCAASATGTFGPMQSPRQDGGSNGWNYILGLDHTLAAYPSTGTAGASSPDGSCQPSDPQARIDDVWRMNGNNCLVVDPGSSGNNQPLNDGLIGTDVFPGRLAADATAPCTRPRYQVPKGPTLGINNDVLSCFLVGAGTTNADVASPTAVAGKLSSAIYGSPRFFWVPTTWGNGSSVTGCCFAIKQFLPAFLTDETGAASNGQSDATPDNGLTVNGGGHIQSFNIFVMNPGALPPVGGSTTGASSIRLVN